MRTWSLYTRIALIFALVLLCFGVALGWVSYRAAKDHQHEVMQQLSRELAQHIADHGTLLTDTGFDRRGVGELFRMATVVNPTIELYLLDAEGRIVSYSPPEGPLARTYVALGPIKRFLDQEPLPILGDSPRDAGRPGVFSAAAVMRDNEVAGYLYVTLVGTMYQQRADDASFGHVLRTTAWTGVAALALALVVGLAAFAWITRRLDRLTSAVQAFERDSGSEASLTVPTEVHATDEIGRLALAFDHLTARLAAQRVELQRQDRLRRDLVANIAHDLRTPLTSMQTYLETLATVELSPGERGQYLDVAVRQCHRVTRLSQQLFELARLEGEESLPQSERFSLAELVQDIAQKFALSARDKGVRLEATTDSQGLFVRADIGLIERVITNLLDNAIRHTPDGGDVRLEARPIPQGVEVRIADTGSGIAAEHLPGLFERNSPLRSTHGRKHGGLGLLIATRILALHGSRMTVSSTAGSGTVFSFVLPVGAVACIPTA